MSKNNMKPIALAISAAFATSLASGIASADVSPFSMTSLVTGYMADAGDAAKKGEEGKCGEGKCGEDKGEEGKCGEGKCGEGKCGEDKGEEGKCGEGKCGEDKGEEGSCGEDQ